MVFFTIISMEHQEVKTGMCVFMPNPPHMHTHMYLYTHTKFPSDISPLTFTLSSPLNSKHYWQKNTVAR